MYNSKRSWIIWWFSSPFKISLQRPPEGIWCWCRMILVQNNRMSLYINIKYLECCSWILRRFVQNWEFEEMKIFRRFHLFVKDGVIVLIWTRRTTYFSTSVGEKTNRKVHQCWRWTFRWTPVGRVKFVLIFAPSEVPSEADLNFLRSKVVQGRIKLSSHFFAK